MVDFAKLAAPFPPEQISWRIGSVTSAGDRGMALAYLDARDVMDRLDAVCGPAGWQCKYTHAGQKTICDIGIMTHGAIMNAGGIAGIPSVVSPAEWVWKADGAGDSDIEAEKGALSDAFKRAAVRWGIGRYLYHLPSPWVEIEKRGRTSIIKDSEYAKLEALLAKASGPVDIHGHPHKAAAAEAVNRPTLPPQPTDVQAAVMRWAADQRLFLSNCQTAEDVNGWVGINTAQLKKLKLSHRDLWDGLKDAKDMALDRVRAPI